MWPTHCTAILLHCYTRGYMWPTHCTDDSSGWLLSAWSAHDWYSIDSMTSSCEVTINQHWVLHFIEMVVASSSSNQKINYHTAPTHLKCWLGVIYMIRRLLNRFLLYFPIINHLIHFCSILSILFNFIPYHKFPSISSFWSALCYFGLVCRLACYHLIVIILIAYRDFRYHQSIFSKAQLSSQPCATLGLARFGSWVVINRSTLSATDACCGDDRDHVRDNDVDDHDYDRWCCWRWWI